MDNKSFGHDLKTISQLKTCFEHHVNKARELRNQAEVECDKAKQCGVRLFEIIDGDFLEITKQIRRLENDTKHNTKIKSKDSL